MIVQKDFSVCIQQYSFSATLSSTTQLECIMHCTIQFNTNYEYHLLTVNPSEPSHFHDLL